jgi:hypothetical protein
LFSHIHTHCSIILCGRKLTRAQSEPRFQPHLSDSAVSNLQLDNGIGGRPVDVDRTWRRKEEERRIRRRRGRERGLKKSKGQEQQWKNIHNTQTERRTLDKVAFGMITKMESVAVERGTCKTHRKKEKEEKQK